MAIAAVNDLDIGDDAQEGLGDFWLVGFDAGMGIVQHVAVAADLELHVREFLGQGANGRRGEAGFDEVLAQGQLEADFVV